jgi:hypothetical protein
MEKQKIEEKQQLILELVRDFCAKKVDEEYVELAEKLLQKLGRKRNVPFITGKPEIWAAAIIHALGTINFLFDKSFEPYLSVNDINDYFGTSKSTTGNKSKQIRELLNLDYWNNEFSTKRLHDSNPFTNLVMVNGFIVPLDILPQQYQQAKRQKKGRR